MNHPIDPPKKFAYICRNHWELITIRELNEISKEFSSFKKEWSASSKEDWWTLLKTYSGTGSAKSGIKYDKTELSKINKKTRYVTFFRPRNEFNWYEVYFGEEFS